MSDAANNTAHLTSEQRAIISQRARSVLIGAVAGSGKTTTLAHCVAHNLRAGLAPRDVLVLVFTPAAQDVFRQRLAQAGAGAGVRVATYGEFAQALLDGWRESSHIDGAQAWLPDAASARDVVFDAIEAAAESQADPDYEFSLTALHAEILLNQLSRLKGMLTLRQLDEASNAELADELDLPRGLIAICRVFEQRRQLDLGAWAWQNEADLVYDVLGLLDAMPGQLPLPGYALIVADEWHDANAGHMALLTRLAGDDARVVAAGDREQVVHSWNGADPQFMGDTYLQAFPGSKRLPLTLSFRCGPTLAACAQAVSGQTFGSARLHDTVVTTHPYDGSDAAGCARQVLDAVDILSGPGHDVPLSDMAVLLRAPYQGIAIENLLIERGIAYRVDGFESYFDRVEIRMMRGLLHVAEGSIVAAGPQTEIRAILRALGQLALLDYDEADWKLVERAMAEDPISTWNGFLQQMRRVRQHELDDQADMRWRAQVAQVCDTLLAERGNWTAAQLLTHAATALRLADRIKGWVVRAEDARAIARSIDSFIAYAEQTGLGAGDFLLHLAQGQQRAAALHRRKGQHLTLATARDAKGKEWRRVFLPNMVDGEFPDVMADQREERRLFYVAITRAIDGVHLFVPQAGRSRLVEAMRLPAAQAASAARLQDNREQAAAPPLRVYLNVPYADKDEAKALGAQWDAVARKWWVGPGATMRLFARWRIKG